MATDLSPENEQFIQQEIQAGVKSSVCDAFCSLTTSLQSWAASLQAREPNHLSGRFLDARSTT